MHLPPNALRRRAPGSPKSARDLLDLYPLEARSHLLEAAATMVEYLRGHPGVDPQRVTIDHCEEHTLKMVLDAGFWAAMTIYPTTKKSARRVVDAFEVYGAERLMVDASGDWGPSDPVHLHDAIFEMRRRGHREARIETLFYDNPCFFLSQNPKFTFKASRPRQEAWA